MDLTVSSVMAGLMFGLIGIWLFREGKKRVNFYLIFIGIVIMVFPYFVDGDWLPWAVGIMLCFAARFFWNRSI